MKKFSYSLAVSAFSITTLLSSHSAFAANSSDQLSGQSLQQIADEAYVYAYPLVTMDVTRLVSTNVNEPKGQLAPMGQFANLRTFPDASFRTVTAPNADTLYSVAWLNLSKEPYVLHVPDEHGRYYLMPMLDAWTNVFASPGSRTAGTKEHNFAIVGPDWHGALPKMVTEIKAPTNMVWIIGRTYCSGTAEDYKKVHDIQNQYTLTPLSYFGRPFNPSQDNVIDLNIDMKTPPRDQTNNMDAQNYYNKLALLLAANPPAKADAQMIKSLKELGIVAGKPFNLNKVDPQEKEALINSTKSGLKEIESNIPNVGKVVNGWSITDTGVYGSNYLKRATVAYVGLGANLPQDAIYPLTSVDNKGNPLDGKNNYVIHFDKNQMPPVKGFWSLSMYDSQYYFVSNDLNRYSIGTKDSFKYNTDGSLDIYIQHNSPGSDKESNWLPAPSGYFNLTFRFYWPSESIINGEWFPPTVQIVQ